MHSNYALGVSYILHTIYITIFGLALTVEKFNPQVIFHNSKTGLNLLPLCSFGCITFWTKTV